MTTSSPSNVGLKHLDLQGSNGYAGMTQSFYVNITKNPTIVSVSNVTNVSNMSDTAPYFK